ncbi:MAG: NADH-quinone oxidoreductase subunit J [Opitutaceae bacterium]|nr:NADH-quinone oxidoreductase subunit J [Opitutaceae bacterium]
MLPLVVIALLTLATAAVAMALRNLIHSALLLIGSWGGIAAFYLWAGAEFVAFAQVLVYVGAISMVVLFAVLLTRRSRTDIALAPDSVGRAFAAIVTGGAVVGVLAGAILSSPLGAGTVAGNAPAISVRDLGLQLMGSHAAALLVVGGLLTVALLGAVVIASADRAEKEDDRS